MEYLIVVNDLDKKRIVKKISLEENIHNYKVMSYNEFVKKLYFDYSEESIYYIVKQYDVTPEIAKIYLKNLYYRKDIEEKTEKIEFLNHLWEDLVQHGYIYFAPLWKEKLKKSQIVFYHIAKQDKMYKEIVAECSKITKILEINLDKKKKDTVIIFESDEIEQEVINVCNEICNLIKQGVSPSRIFLTNLNSEYRLMLEMYQEIFHLPFALKKEDSYFSSEIVVEFIQNYENGLENDLEDLKQKYPEIEEQKIIEMVQDICDKYIFIKEEKNRKIFIIEELKNLKKRQAIPKNAIVEIDFEAEEIEEGSFLFVLGVHEGNFPTMKKEEDFLSSKECALLGFDTIEETNKRRKEYYKRKLLSFTKSYLSYSNKNGKVEQTLSSIFDDIPYKKEKILEEQLGHSHLYNIWLLGSLLDKEKKYGSRDTLLNRLQNAYPHSSYNAYQNEFQTFKRETKPFSVSYTSLDTFFHCSFRYYLDYILKLNKYEETFDKKVGTLFHQILCEMYNDSFDFENSWRENTRYFEIQNKREEFFLNKLKRDIKRVVEEIKKQEKENDYQVLLEQKIEQPIREDVLLTGIIDKVYYQKNNGQTNIALVDYKTGNNSVSFDSIIYGLNMQLAIYLLLVHELPFENISMIGLYLQKILPPIPERDKIHTEEELKKKKLMLQGYSTDETNLLSSFDPGYEDSKLIQGMKTSSKGFYAYSKVLSKENFEKIEQTVLEQVKEAVKKIKENDFFINPKRIGNKLVGCDYCPYQDICYRNEKNIVNKREVKLKEWLGGEKRAELDERTVKSNS